MATESLSREPAEDLKTFPMEHTASDGGEALNPGENDVRHDNKKMPPDDPSGDDVCGQEVHEVAICQFFLLGRCHFGDRCRLSHCAPQSSSVVRESGHGAAQDGGSRKKSGKAKKMQTKGKIVKAVEEKESTKKPRMRTADDVISRILWDPSLDPTDFSVGYLDRFLGILERPFSEFSWDTDISSCNYDEELALPRHRIQYFTYRGRRVWDRESRMDGVFGSTGGPLEPPFVPKSEEEEGNLMQETGPEESEELCRTNDELQAESSMRDCYNQDSCHRQHGDNEEKVAQMAEAAQSDITCIPIECPQGEGDARTGEEVCESEAVDDNDLSTMTAEIPISEAGNTDREGDDGGQEEWKEEWEEEDLWLLSSAVSHASAITESPFLKDGLQSKPLEQRERTNRRKPTHFIAVRADTPTLLLGFQRLQKEITSLLPLTAPHWVSPNSLHITLCLLVLSGPSEVNTACEILREFAQKHSQHPPTLSFPPKLGHFGGRVLFLPPQPLSEVRSLNKPLQEVYSRMGLLHRDSVSPNYHLTLAKIDGKCDGRVFAGVQDKYSSAALKAIDFGKLPVRELHLCVNGRAKMEDGFYETVCVVKLQ